MGEKDRPDTPTVSSLPTWMKVVLPINVAVTALLIVGLIRLQRDRGPAPPTVTQPAGPPRTARSRPTPPASDWPGFQGGGALLGTAPFGPEPPLGTAWTFRAKDAVEGGPAVVAGVVYVGDDGGTLYAIDLKRGEPVWTCKGLGPIATTPLVWKGRVYVGDLDGGFHAIDARTGERAWRLETDGEIHSSANVAGGRIVVGSYDNCLYGIDPKTGDVAWKRETDNYVHCTPAVDDAIYIAGCDATLAAFALDTGDREDTADLAAPAGAAPLPLDDVIVAATMTGTILAFDRLTFEESWRYRADDGGFFSSPAAADGLVVIGSRDGKVHAVRTATATAAWTFDAKSDVDSSPAVASGRVYVGAVNGRLYVLSLTDGRPLWSFNAGRAIRGSPALADGCLVFGDASGAVTCLVERE